MRVFIISYIPFIATLASAQAQVQGDAPEPVLLTMVKSGVLPVLPTATPFVGVETIEGAITNVRLSTKPTQRARG